MGYISSSRGSTSRQLLENPTVITVGIDKEKSSASKPPGFFFWGGGQPANTFSGWFFLIPYSFPVSKIPEQEECIQRLGLEEQYYKNLGGFKYFLFSPRTWGDDPIWLAHIFQMGWWKTTNWKCLWPWSLGWKNWFHWRSLKADWKPATSLERWEKWSSTSSSMIMYLSGPIIANWKRPHPKWWFSKGNPLISGKSRLVKYYNLARSMNHRSRYLFMILKEDGRYNQEVLKILIFRRFVVWLWPRIIAVLHFVVLQKLKQRCWIQLHMWSNKIWWESTLSLCQQMSVVWGSMFHAFDCLFNIDTLKLTWRKAASIHSVNGFTILVYNDWHLAVHPQINNGLTRPHEAKMRGQ